MALLRVVAKHFVAGAVWSDGRCTRAAPIIKWMAGMGAAEAKRELEARRLKWEWVR